MKMRMILSVCLICLGILSVQAQSTMTDIEKKAEALAQEQLEAYNDRDIDRFLRPYAENCKIYMYPDQFLYEGKDAMRERYTQRFSSEGLHCKLLSRMVVGNTVIDHEEITGIEKDKLVYAIAIYKIENDKIAEVRFILN